MPYSGSSKINDISEVISNPWARYWYQWEANFNMDRFDPGNVMPTEIVQKSWRSCLWLSLGHRASISSAILPQVWFAGSFWRTGICTFCFLAFWLARLPVVLNCVGSWTNTHQTHFTQGHQTSDQSHVAGPDRGGSNIPVAMRGVHFRKEFS